MTMPYVERESWQLWGSEEASFANAVEGASPCVMWTQASSFSVPPSLEEDVRVAFSRALHEFSVVGDLPLILADNSYLCPPYVLRWRLWGADSCDSL
mmetsp:Transcript_4029/g.11280  ORF Transcript_4029/g.11280 Transcript_4029/m.11280 type:complete len:97 (-) Transcript_4029:17-307(-)